MVENRNWQTVGGGYAQAAEMFVTDNMHGAGVAAVFVVGDPNGTVSGTMGQLAIDRDTGDTYQNVDGATAWAPFSGGGGGTVGPGTVPQLAMFTGATTVRDSRFYDFGAGFEAGVTLEAGDNPGEDSRIMLTTKLGPDTRAAIEVFSGNASFPSPAEIDIYTATADGIIRVSAAELRLTAASPTKDVTVVSARDIRETAARDLTMVATTGEIDVIAHSLVVLQATQNGNVQITVDASAVPVVLRMESDGRTLTQGNGNTLVDDAKLYAPNGMALVEGVMVTAQATDTATVQGATAILNATNVEGTTTVSGETVSVHARTLGVEISATLGGVDIEADAPGAVRVQSNAAGLLGFYGNPGIALQVGVAVNAAAIHAALVALGLIAP